MWVKLDQKLFTFDNDLYFCHIYIPPLNSKVIQDENFDFFESLELCITKYKDLGKVFISGDFNSRTSNLPDYVEFDKYLDTNIPFVCCYDIPKRINSDKIIDAQGKRLLDLCISTGLLIANGRLHADKNVGKFTFSSHRGESTVDYLLLELDDFSTLCDFEVLDFTEFSDHAAVTFCMLCNNEISKNSDNTHL